MRYTFIPPQPKNSAALEGHYCTGAYNRGHFPNDESASKLLYLALRNASEKWTMPIVGWKKALTQFAISYKDRVPGFRS
jgi:transposase-like protein